MRMLLRTAAVVTALLFPAAAHADPEGGASIIDYGTSDGSGVKATAVSFTPDGRPTEAARTGSVAIETSASAPAPVPAPVPVAISAHNCVPRVDARGVSLSFVFSEGGGDCVSFVSPVPAPARRRGPHKTAAPDPARLAQAAYDRVISLAPRPSISVAPARLGLTGLDSFFWVGNDLEPVTASAGVPGLTVTAEARPVRYLWDFGDGGRAARATPGRPWTPRRDGDLAHLYETKGRYDVGVEVVWAARWRIGGGTWRDLGYFSNTGSLGYPVREMVAVLTRRR